MTAAATVLAYAAGGVAPGLLPADRVAAAPADGPDRRGPRLGLLAVALGDRLRAASAARAPDGVVVGTSRGCMTESNQFLELMIRENEASPSPRAFAGSVHNAVASLLALRAGARALCRTPSHGATSCAVAVELAARALRRGDAACVVAGAVDERPGFLAPAYPSDEARRAEGGGLLLLAPEGTSGGLASVRVAYARPRDAAGWLSDRIREHGPDLVLVGGDGPAAESAVPDALAYASACGFHPSAGAAALAWATALVCGDAAPVRPGPEPRRVGVATVSRFGDAAYVAVAAAT